MGTSRPEKRSLWWLIVVLMPVMAGCVSQRVHEAALAEKQALAQTNERLVKQLEELRKQVRGLTANLAGARDELDALNRKLEEKNAALARINDQLTLKGEQMQRTSRELARLDEQLRLRKQQLREAERRAVAAEQAVHRSRELYESLVAELSNEVAAKQIKIREMKDGVTLNLAQDILFPSGSAVLNDAGRSVLRKVSGQLQDLPYQIMVAGFSDNVPIKGGLREKYPTNWELAGARAASVVRLLEQNGVDRSRLVAMSFGENRPIADNDTAAGRALNRRIEIRLKPLE